jgi:hypothetical protein
MRTLKPKGRKMTQAVQQKKPPLQQQGVITRIEDFGLGYVKADSGYYAFEFDKIEGYGGETLHELGLRAGSPVVFDADGAKLLLLRKS